MRPAQSIFHVRNNFLCSTKNVVVLQHLVSNNVKMLLCQAINCNNRRESWSDKSFFAIPNPEKDRERCAIWLRNIGTTKHNIDTYKYSKYRVVCEDHFEKSAFIEDKVAKALGYKLRKLLRPDAVPTIFQQRTFGSLAKAAWMCDFMKCHPDISLRKAEGLPHARALCMAQTIEKDNLTEGEHRDRMEGNMRVTYMKEEEFLPDEYKSVYIKEEGSMLSDEGASQSVFENVRIKEAPSPNIDDGFEKCTTGENEQQECGKEGNEEREEEEEEEPLRLDSEQFVLVKEEPGSPLNDGLDSEMYLTGEEEQTTVHSQSDLLGKFSASIDIKWQTQTSSQLDDWDLPQANADDDTEDAMELCSEISVKSSLPMTTDEDLFQCSYCTMSFSLESKLDQHMESHSGEGSPNQCHVCGLNLESRHKLGAHMRRHSGEKPYRCTLCSLDCRNRTRFRIHMRKHTGERPYVCTVCDRGFAANSQLTKHMRTHTGEKPYPCSVCDKRFPTSYQLTLHVRRHIGVKPYQCLECNMRFASSGELKQHQKYRTGKREFSCSQCNKTFTRKVDMQRHHMTHTGTLEKPFKCSVCEKAFLYNHGLNIHMRKMHGEKTIQVL